MKKRARSEVSISSKGDAGKTEIKEIHLPPLDILNIKLENLTIADDIPIEYYVKATFFDQLLISGTITSTNVKPDGENRPLMGEMSYDPSDYEKIGLFVDTPLIITIEPFSRIHSSKAINSSITCNFGTYCCNIDIATIFTDVNTLLINKRMEPVIKQSVMFAKSWKNLPLITLEIKAHRNGDNFQHHNILKNANYMKITLVGCYNMKIPFEESAAYTCVTKLPISNEKDNRMTIFNNGYKVPERFDHTCFYPQWESLRTDEHCFTKSDNKFRCQIEEIYNPDNFDVMNYMDKESNNNITLWASFHRSLIVKNCEEWFCDHIRRSKWPLEINICRENENYNFMAFVDLLKLLYPGETAIRLIVPLQWADSEIMLEKCGCEMLHAPNDKMSGLAAMQECKATTESAQSTGAVAKVTGSDENNAFVFIEVQFSRALKKACIPPYISPLELKSMLVHTIASANKRECFGRGQQDRDWQETVRNAANALRKISFHGQPDFCSLTGQLNVSKTRVELETSFWQQAAIYANNNFILDDFLGSGNSFEEMLMMTHACMMRIANETLTGCETKKELDPTIRAARHARHLQDIPHAVDLFLQAVVEHKRDADCWRELATCLQDVDRDWANICINKSINLNPRHRLSLLSKACLIFDENPDDAEPFFIALLALNPFWVPLWVTASAYFYQRELYDTAHDIIECIKRTIAEGITEGIRYPRTWGYELGDWWDQTPLLPGTSLYYDAADLLLRIRGITLAEICISRALSEVGETAMHYHLLALCCRLRGDIDNAICYLKQGNEKFPGICYLKTLEGECHNKKGNFTAAIACFEKNVGCSGPFITLLSLSTTLPQRDPQRILSALMDLVRRQPSAYAWMIFADYWLAIYAKGGGGDSSKSGNQDTNYAIACAVQALKWDRRAGYAWAMLSNLVKPSARRLFCQNMATLCDYSLYEPKSEHSSESQQSLSTHLGRPVKECDCHKWEETP